MSQALYRKYRSKRLEEVVGQNHVTDILSRSLEQGKIAHAYLLTGPRGVGKTSIARILAHEINHLPYTDDATHVDIIEIDAASNNGVEDVRDLREKVQLAPVSAAKKVYIIDEVHMLSKAAFNALLKTLEEPPEHVVFILATTDVDKLPATVISRTQQFGFHAISEADITRHLRDIADKENIMITDEALALIALRGEGSFRDSISLLDQLSSLSLGKEGITAELVETSLGLAPHTLIEQILAAYAQKDIGHLIRLLQDADQNGLQATVLATQLIQTIRQQLTNTPELLPLLDQLLDVARSPQPVVKLLTTMTLPLLSASKPPKTIALSAPTPTLTVPIPEKTPPHLKPKKDHLPKKEVLTDPEPPQKVSVAIPSPSQVFNWDQLLEYLRKHHVALHSVVSKCSHDINGGSLILYTQNNFYKKKLDDTKYTVMLAEAMEVLGMNGYDVSTIPTQQPPKDSTAAAVAAIMGGGQEVSLDEDVQP